MMFSASKIFSRRILAAPAAWAIALSLVPAVVQGQDFSCLTNNGSITITRYTGSSGTVTIPATIGTLTVTSIGDFAFAYCASVTNVIIPDTVTNIGEIAFSSCTGLSHVNIPASVTSIGEIPFQHCVNLSAIAVDTNNPTFSALNGVLFDKDQATLLQYPEGKGGGSYTVPNSVTCISTDAFYNCTSLTNVSVSTNSPYNLKDGAFYGCGSLANFTIPSGVTNIGIEAFQYCGSLANIVIPDSVISVGFQAFYACGGLTNAVVGNGTVTLGYNTFGSCSKLATVKLGNSLTSVDFFDFRYCSALASVTFGASITNIGDSAFAYCYNLSSVTLPNSLTTIGDDAFEYCSSLATIAIPAGVTSIGVSVFEYCLDLSAITVDAANPAYQGVSGVLFDRDMTTLIQYPEGGTAGSYTIPNGVVNIASTAFAFCFYLGSVTIPSSVSNIEELAFYDCVNVTGFFFTGNPPSLGNYVFDLDNSATAYYLPGATGWGSKFGGLPTALWNPQTAKGRVDIQTKAFGFYITGVTNTPILVEASTNPVTGPWTVLQNCTITNGSFYFSDPQWINYPARYYRIRSP